MPGLLASDRGFALVGGLSLLYADGLLHWFAILEHIGAVPFMWFFAVSGAVQVFAIPFALRSERVAWWSGVALSVFFLVLYAAVLVAPEPLNVEPEGVTGLGLLSKAAELGILGGMAGYSGRGSSLEFFGAPPESRRCRNPACGRGPDRGDYRESDGVRVTDDWRVYDYAVRQPNPRRGLKGVHVNAASVPIHGNISGDLGETGSSVFPSQVAALAHVDGSSGQKKRCLSARAGMMGKRGPGSQTELDASFGPIEMC